MPLSTGSVLPGDDLAGADDDFGGTTAENPAAPDAQQDATAKTTAVENFMVV